MAWPYVSSLDNGAVATATVGGVSVTRAGNGYVPPALAPGSDPVVAITSPANGVTITEDSVAFLADASDGDGIDYVEMYVDDVLEATEGTAPYGWGGADGVPPFDLTGYANGSLPFRVRAYDTLGNFTEVTHTITLDRDTEPPGGTPGVADWYISPSGSDSTGDGSSSTPWATIGKAYSEAAKGDIIEMAGGSYAGTTIPYSAAKDVTVTLPTSAGNFATTGFAETPVTFRVASGATVSIGSCEIRGCVQFDGEPGTLTISVNFGSGGSTVDTGKVGVRYATCGYSQAVNSPAGLILERVIWGQNVPAEADTFQCKANASGTAPRGVYLYQTVVWTSQKAIGSSKHTDTIQIGGTTGFVVEESYVQSQSDGAAVQGFFAKQWTNPCTGIRAWNNWLEYTNMSDGVSGAVFIGNDYETPFGVGSGATSSGNTQRSGGTLEGWYGGGSRPWD